MKIENTELECKACDEVCLDYYLGQGHETKDQWAKRVWDNCKLYKENDGKDLSGNPLPKVYARDATDLWEEKKRRRRAAFVEELTGEVCDPDLLRPEKIREDSKEKKECNWPESHSTARIMSMKDDPKYNYKTATQKSVEDESKHVARHEKVLADRKARIEELRTKFDDETIKVLFPQGADLL